MRRREFITLLGGAAAWFVSPDIRRLTLTNFRSYRAAQIEVCAHRVVQNGRSDVGLRDEGRLAAPLCCFADQRSALAIA